MSAPNTAILLRSQWLNFNSFTAVQTDYQSKAFMYRTKCLVIRKSQEYLNYNEKCNFEIEEYMLYCVKIFHIFRKDGVNVNLSYLVTCLN